MPEIENAGVRLYYELSGIRRADVLVLGNSLGSNLHMWDKVLPSLESRYRIVRFDTRGHGRSGVSPSPYNIVDLGSDLLALLDWLGMERVNFCGLSLGGMLAMWLGIHAPHRVRRLVLANTAARIGTTEMWEDRIETVKRLGMAAIAEATPARWFTSDYRDKHTSEMERIQEMVAATDTQGYEGCCSVLRDADLRTQISSISAPCLVIAGKHDPATPASAGRAIHHVLPDSRYVELDASHLSAWERPAEFAAAVMEFLQTGEAHNG